MLVNALHHDWQKLLGTFVALEAAVASVVLLDSKLLPYLTRERQVDNTLVQMIANMRARVSSASTHLSEAAEVNASMSSTFLRIGNGAQAVSDFEGAAQVSHGHA